MVGNDGWWCRIKDNVKSLKVILLDVNLWWSMIVNISGIRIVMMGGQSWMIMDDIILKTPLHIALCTKFYYDGAWCTIIVIYT